MLEEKKYLAFDLLDATSVFDDEVRLDCNDLVIFCVIPKHGCWFEDTRVAIERRW